MGHEHDRAVVAIDGCHGTEQVLKIVALAVGCFLAAVGNGGKIGGIYIGHCCDVACHGAVAAFHGNDVALIVGLPVVLAARRPYHVNAGSGLPQRLLALDARRAVVVAGRHYYCHCRACLVNGQHAIGKHLDCGCRRRSGVVDIAAHYHGIGLLVLDYCRKLCKKIVLLGRAVVLVKHLAQVPVAGVEYFHHSDTGLIRFFLFSSKKRESVCFKALPAPRGQLYNSCYCFT